MHDPTLKIFLVEGARSGGEDSRKCELFDCHEDPLKLFKCYSDVKYKDVVVEMMKLLERKMAKIGDEVAHEKVAFKYNNAMLYPGYLFVLHSSLPIYIVYIRDTWI